MIDYRHHLLGSNPLANLFWKQLRKSRLYALTLVGRKITHLNAPKRDLWRGNAAIGEGLLQGKFTLHEHVFLIGDFIHAIDKSANQLTPLTSYAHSFTFLYDLATLNGGRSRKYARQLIERWIRTHHAFSTKSWSTQSWEPWIVGLRLSAWLNLYDFYASTADDDFKHLLLTSIDKQIRFLKRHWQEETNPLLRFWALKSILLVYELKLIDGTSHELSILLAAFGALNKKQLLSDGGHESRSPLVHWRYLRDLIDVRYSINIILGDYNGRYQLNNASESDQKPAKRNKTHERITNILKDTLSLVQHTIQRMTPILRLLRHGDGELARFPGHIIPPIQGICYHLNAESVDNVLSVTNTDTVRPPQRAPISGYERCSNRNSVLLVNTYPLKQTQSAANDSVPPVEPSAELLTLEWSVGYNRIIEKGDIVIQRDDRTWITDLDETKMQLRIKRHSTESYNYIAFDCTYQDDTIAFEWQRHIYVSTQGEELRGVDTFKMPYNCLIGVRFMLSPSITIHNENGKLTITYPSKAKMKREERMHKSTKNTGTLLAPTSMPAYIGPNFLDKSPIADTNILPNNEQTQEYRKHDQHEWLFKCLGSDETMTTSENGQRTILLMKAYDANKTQTFKWSYNHVSAIDPIE